MGRLQWRLTQLPRRLCDKVQKWSVVQRVSLLFNTLFYNYFTSWTVVMETGFEPIFCTVDRFSKYLGPIFMTLVVLLTTSVVVIFYICLLPHVYEQSLSKTIFHLVFGHWLLINIVFSYVMAAFTNPGNPPREVPETVSICKKCISPKPPRAHHCSICDKCILKMDHHCPWLNNCIGYYNHRYFFQFCCYMFFGTIYVCVTGVDLFKQHFYGTQEYLFPAVFYPLNLAYDAIYGRKGIYASSAVVAMSEDDESKASYHGAVIEVDYREQRYHNAIIYEFVICSAVALALGCLVLWHVYMISSAETNIEIHINKKERQRLKKVGLVFRNPYHYGFVKNWKVFFGLSEGRSFFRHVLLPSTHSPIGNGLTYPKAGSQHERGLQLL